MRMVTRYRNGPLDTQISIALGSGALVGTQNTIDEFLDEYKKIPSFKLPFSSVNKDGSVTQSALREIISTVKSKLPVRDPSSDGGVNEPVQ